MIVMRMVHEYSMHGCFSAAVYGGVGHPQEHCVHPDTALCADTSNLCSCIRITCTSSAAWEIAQGDERAWMRLGPHLGPFGLAVAGEGVHSKDRGREVLRSADVGGCRAPPGEALAQAVGQIWRMPAYCGIAGQSLQ